jgi:prolycopene isomerase
MGAEAARGRAASTPGSDSYDVVVAGGGIGGLSAAAFLSAGGLRVLLVERQDGVGGYARAFRHGPYTFDPAVHVYPDAAPDGLPMSLYRFLGVDSMLDFRPVSPYYRAATRDVDVTFPLDLEGFIEEHQRLFPAEREAIDTFFRLCSQVHREAHIMKPTLGLAQLDELAVRYPVLFRYARAAADTAVKEYLVDPRLQALATIKWPQIGTPPATASLVTLSTHIFVFLLDGMYYPVGSAQTTVDALAAAVARHRGETVVERSVERVVIDGGRVSGVLLDGGDRVSTPVVIGALDAPTLFERLIGLDQLPSGFVKRFRRMQVGHSAVLAYAGTTLDLEAMGAAHEFFLLEHESHEAAWDDVIRGNRGGTWMAVPTLGDPSLAPPGEHAITFTSIANYDAEEGWALDKERFADGMIGAFERFFPGLRDSLTMLEVATPPTLEHFTGNSRGAAYGWDNTANQAGGRRSPREVPGIAGLFLAGHWTQPGSGTIRCLVSGFHTAQSVLRSLGRDLLPFEHHMMPPV